MKKTLLIIVLSISCFQAFAQAGFYVGPRYSMIQSSWVETYQPKLGFGFGFATLTEINDEFAFLYDVGVDQLGAEFSSYDYFFYPQGEPFDYVINWWMFHIGISAAISINEDTRIFGGIDGGWVFTVNEGEDINSDDYMYYTLDGTPEGIDVFTIKSGLDQAYTGDLHLGGSMKFGILTVRAKYSYQLINNTLTSHFVEPDDFRNNVISLDLLIGWRD